MKEQGQIMIGKTRISDGMIQTAYQGSVKKNQTHQMLTNTFHVLNLAQKNQSADQQEIQQLVNQNMISRNSVAEKKTYLNHQTVYPLIKGGGFGTLERQCQITKDGLYEKQEKKEPVLKQVKGLLSNKVEVFGDKANNKIEWVKNSKEYRYRVIVEGDKKQPKAIFFKTFEEAERIRIYYYNKFNNKGSFLKTMAIQNKCFEQSIIDNFKYCIVNAKLAKKKKSLEIRESKMKERQSKSQLSQTNQQYQPGNSPQHSIHNNLREANISNEEPIDKIIRTSKPKSQQGYQPKMMDLMKDNRPSPQTMGLFYQMQGIYIQSFFDQWRQKAKEADFERQENLNRMDNIFLKNEQSPPLIQNNQESNISKSRLENSNLNKSVINNKSILHKSPQRSVKSSRHHSQKSVTFTKVQFLDLTNSLIKPIVSLSLLRSDKKVYECVFNTMIKSKDPYLVYGLVPTSGEPTYQLSDELTNYDVGIRIVDYLTNSQLFNEKISLKTKVFSYFTSILNQNRDLRLQIKYENQEFAEEKSMQVYDNPQGTFLQISPIQQKQLQTIKRFWQKQSTKRGYYNLSKNIKVIQILQLIEEPPVSWSLGLNSQEYKIISHLNVASKILGFKLIPAFLPIAKSLQKIYSELQQLIEACLSIILYHMDTYYFQQHFNRTQKLHRMIGLQGQIEYSSKTWLELAMLKKIVKIENPEVHDKLSRKNICYQFLIYEYIHQIYSKVFPIKTLMEIWNFCFRDQADVRMYLILIGAWVMRFYASKIMRCQRFSDLVDVLQSHELCTSEIIIKDLLVLKQKYFEVKSSKGIIQSIKGFFDNKPLQEIATDFYKRETSRMDIRKDTRQVQKQVVLEKLNKQLSIELPSYPSKTYCFHIYFYRLPSVPGSLYIKCNGIEYQCLNYTENSYFIIGEIGTEAILQFVNNKSTEFTAKMMLSQGINRYRVQLISEKYNQTYKVEYLCGLLTQAHIQALKKNRKFDNYIATYMKKQEVFDEMLRPVGECSFLNSYTRRLQKQDLGKKIKIIFSSGNRTFNELQFYLRWIASSPLTLPQKLELMRKYANNLSNEFYLCHNKQLQKLLTFQFLEIIGFPISSLAFESFYADSLNSQFKAAKILKCRLFLPSGKQIKLEKAALEYHAAKSQTHFYGDIVLSELLDKIGMALDSQISSITECSLSLLYSSNGQVHHKVIPVIKRKNNRDLVVDMDKYEMDNPSERTNLAFLQPQLLVTQILPTFSKISSILDYVHQNHSRSIDKFSKTQRERQELQRKIPQKINLLNGCHEKLKDKILMRYSQYPEELIFPFLAYYHDLIYDLEVPNIPKNIYLNNIKTDIHLICSMNNKIYFSDNKRSQIIRMNPTLGLYGNLRQVSPKINDLYFTTQELNEEKEPNGFLFINYGFGIHRWEPCVVLGYIYQTKEQQSERSKQKNVKKNYLVRYGKKEEYHRQFQVEIRPQVEQGLKELNMKPDLGTVMKTKSQAKSKSSRNMGLSKLLASNY